MKNNEFTATGKLLMHNLRQNKVLFGLLILLPLLVAYGTAVSNIKILGTPDALQQYIVESAASPASIGMLGPIFSATVAGVTIWRVRVSTAMFAAIFSIIIVVKHTRREEETGRLELLRAGAVGRKASLTAAMLKVYGANIIGGMLMTAGFAAAGFPFFGSLAAGLATALCGCCFAALAAAAAQLAASSRTAYAVSFVLLGLSMVFQTIGNFQIDPGAVFYLSPFSWGVLVRPLAGERFGVFVFALLYIALITAAAYELASKRDLGAGLIPDRSGRAEAKPGFNNPFALAWRLQRGMLLGWAAAYAVVGAVIGSLVVTVGAMFEGIGELSGWIAVIGGPGNAFLYILTYILAQISSAYAITAVLHLRAEEAELRAEPVLTGPVSRAKWAAGHLLFVFFGSAAIVAAMGLGAGITSAAVTGDGGSLMRVFLLCIAKIPAVWVVASLAVFLYGFVPKLSAGISWCIVGLFIVLEFLWELGIIGMGVFRLSPFSYVYPTNGIALVPIIVLTLISAVLTAAGTAGLRRREIGR